ncbi:MAG: hypothetical protein B6D59_01030 [Campylobacteraceae bacterium 4484_4]|nr:MAG: hypothetical protein B6D59_01030 [Campylobacteraceae bacterium 4484_4]
MQTIKRTIHLLLFLLPLLWQGCRVVSDHSAYTRSELFSIVHTVLDSQHALSYAALITSEGVDSLPTPSRTRTLYTETYLCQQGDAGILFYDNDRSFDFSPSDRMEIDYHRCRPYQGENGDAIDGPLMIEYNQNLKQSEYRRVDYSITYKHLRLQTGRGDWEIEGNVGVRYTLSYIDDTMRLSLNSNRLSLVRDGIAHIRLSNTELDFSMRAKDLFYRYRYDGTIHDPLLGNFGFDTLESFEGYGSHNPLRGKMRIIGENLTILLYLHNSGAIDLDVAYPQTDERRAYETDWRELGF